ncbi:MAG: DUF1559 domain-containing protein [Pirellulaceae bacterium]
MHRTSYLYLALLLLCYHCQPGFSQTLSVRDFISDDFVAGAVVHPQQFWQSELIQEVVSAIDPESKFDIEIKSLVEQLGVDPRQVTEVASVLIDADTLHQVYRVSDAELGKQPDEEELLLNGLMQIGLGHHNYHDTFKSFPADGPGMAIKSDLSWRVHLLPFIGQQPLFDQFHLDEPWDSDHNRGLLEKMPDVFKTPGVEKSGETSFHRFDDQMSVQWAKEE